MATVRHQRRSVYQPSLGSKIVENVSGAIVAWLVLSWPKKLASMVIAVVVLYLLVAIAGGHSAGRLFGFLRGGSLPASVRDRASLFAQAWAEHDEAAMRRFVLPANDEQFGKWIAATPVGKNVASLRRSERSVKSVSSESNDSGGITVAVHFTCHPAAGAAWEFVQEQLWTNSGGNWYFLPEAAPKPTEVAVSRPAAHPLPRVADVDAEHDLSVSSSRAPNRAAAASPSAFSGSRNVVIPSSVPPWQRNR